MKDEMQQIAGRFVSKFLRVFSNINIYPREHSLISEAIEEIFRAVHKADNVEGGFHLAIKMGYLYLNGYKLEVRVDNYPFYKRLMGILRDREIGELEIIPSLLTRDELYRFFQLIGGTEIRGEEIVSHLIAGKFNSIIVRPQLESYEEENIKAKAEKLYFQTIALVKNYFTQMAHKRVSLIKLKAASSYLAELLGESEDVLLGLTIIKNYDDYTYNHCLNVAILSIALGIRLGLPKEALVNLGSGALIHDIGKINIPIEIINKPERLTEGEWEIVKGHPVEGLALVLSRWGVSKETTRLLVPVVEHHLGLNFSGYPEFMRSRKPPFSSRLIHIADFYDAVTTPRVYNPNPLSPAEAVGYLLGHSGTRFDPVLVKFFVNMMGLYPVGTMVKLNTGEWGIVVKRPRELDVLDRPIVKVVMTHDGSLITPQLLDLGDNSVDIVKIISPWELGIDPADYTLKS